MDIIHMEMVGVIHRWTESITCADLTLMYNELLLDVNLNLNLDIEVGLISKSHPTFVTRAFQLQVQDLQRYERVLIEIDVSRARDDVMREANQETG